MTQQIEVLEKVKKLIALSQSDNEEEARTAAMQATRMMKEHKLALVPESEIERVKKVIGEAQAIAKASQEEGTKKMMMGALAGWAFAQTKL